MPNFRSYYVRVSDADGVYNITGWGEVNARLCFAAWMANLGATCLAVALYGVDMDGNERRLESASLRTDLHPAVAPRPLSEQMTLFD